MKRHKLVKFCRNNSKSIKREMQVDPDSEDAGMLLDAPSNVYRQYVGDNSTGMVVPKIRPMDIPGFTMKTLKGANKDGLQPIKTKYDELIGLSDEIFRAEDIEFKHIVIYSYLKGSACDSTIFVTSCDWIKSIMTIFFIYLFHT